MIWFFCKRIDFDIPWEFFDSISAEGAVAQLEERVVRNDEVGGSIPLGSTISKETDPQAFEACGSVRFGIGLGQKRVAEPIGERG